MRVLSAPAAPGTNPVAERTNGDAIWPSARTLLAQRRTAWSNLGRRLRIRWAVLRSRRWRHVVEGVAAGRPHIAAILSQNPGLLLPLFGNYLDVRLSMEERFAGFAHDLEFVSSRVRRSVPDFLPVRRSAALYHPCDGPFAIELSLNTENPQEGLWRLTLFDERRFEVYFLCFSALPGPRFFIGAIQGGNKGSGSDRLAVIRAATKHFAGLRPPFVLLHVLRQMAAACDIKCIVGVSDAHQLTTKTKPQRRQSVHFSYDRFFVEARAERSARGNWQVPLATAERAPAEAPHHKRPMYRRRALLLQELSLQVAAKLAPS